MAGGVSPPPFFFLFFFSFFSFHMVAGGRIGGLHKDYWDRPHSTVHGVLMVRLSLPDGGLRSFPDKVLFYPHLRGRR